MLLTLQRTMRGDRYTMGTLAINGFEGIRIHVGNTSKDTKECICSNKNNPKTLLTLNIYEYLCKVIVTLWFYPA